MTGASPGNRLNALRGILAAAVTAAVLCLATLASASMIRDTEIEAGLVAMLAPLEQAAGYAPGSIDMRVILNQEYNAFVAAKRMIFMHSGLLIEASSELEVIGVMAHELGHIKEGHVQRTDDELKQASGAAALATAAAIAVAAGGQGGAAAGVLIGGNDQATRGYLASRRRAESIADEISLRLLEDTGMSAVGLRDLMQRMARQRSIPESRQSTYYSTHPGAADRLQTFQDHLNMSPHSDTPAPAAVTKLFERIRAKIIAWTESPQRVHAIADDIAPDGSIAIYMKAIAEFRRGDLNNAADRLDELVARHPEDPYFHEFRGDVLFAMARPTDAANAYRTALELRPGSALIQINLGRALIASGGPADLEEAVAVLEAARAFEGEWAFVHRQYGIALGRSGRIAEADLALADEAILLGDGTRAATLARRVLKMETADQVLRSRASDIVFRYSQDRQ
ncbi:MAG: M48 family metalloprotease [Pseudomonadota bacterium]|nr:M48 family metalloprotease [Pseudomonadota bacterium]MEC8088596.1 M48 family metalloprotease [Pseudomonadota bacterium]MEC8129151.1 M48 family metalloprotease [Pseudomonadota bacterium]MED5312809.1 M48 family metalloprotease [Pseudomonadota bacterium]